MALPLVLVALFASPATGWPIPPMLIDEPQSEHEKTYCKLSDRKSMQEAPHAYVIERAETVLRADGNVNWASGINQFYQHLMDGSMYPDRAGPDVNITVSIWFIPIPFDSLDMSFRLCNEASMDHYYNPDTGKGLQLVYWNKLKDLAKKSAPLLSWLGASLVGLDGLLFTTVDINPDIRNQYPSVVDRCAEYLEKAVKAWNGQIPPEPTRSHEETAMFYLGMACHYLADCAVVHHTYDCFMGHHSDYEKEAEGKGDIDAYHATSDGVYDNMQLPLKAFAVAHAKSLAAQVHNYAHFQDTEGKGASTAPGADLQRTILGTGEYDFEKALKHALPLAEQYTAGLIARFFKEIYVHPSTPPLAGYVRSLSGNAIPGAYVFYKRPTYPFWQVTRADRKGRYTLINPAAEILLRPAMPGFVFEGKTLSEVGGHGESFHTKSPFLYKAPTNSQFSTGGDLVSFILSPLPLEAVLSGLLDPKVRQMQLTRTAKFAPADVRAYRAVTMAPRLNLPDTVPPGALLPKSKTKVSPGEADRVSRGLLQTRKVSTRTVRAKDAPLLLAPFADLEFQVHHYVDLNTGKFVVTGTELLQAMDTNQALVKSRIGATPKPRSQVPSASQATLTPDPNLVQGLKLLEKHTGAVPVKRSDGSTSLALRIPSTRELETAGPALLDYGLIPIPATSGVGLEARIVPSPGYLGSAGEPPLKLVTDKDGRVAFRIRPGTNAGKLRVAVRVTNDPLVTYAQPVTTVELMVQPRPGMDIKPRIHPSLESQMPKPLPQVVPPPYAGAGLTRPDADGLQGLDADDLQPADPKVPDTTPVPPQPITPKPTAPTQGTAFHVQVVRHDDLGVFHPVPGTPLRILWGQTPVESLEADAMGRYALKLPPGTSLLELTPSGFPPVHVEIDYDAGRQIVHAERLWPTHRDLFTGTLDVRYRIVLRADDPPLRVQPETARFPEHRPTPPEEPRPPERTRPLRILIRVLEQGPHGQQQPARGAAVEIVRRERTLVREIVSDDGTYRSRALEPALYQVFAERDGAPPTGTDVHLTDRDVEVTLVLHRSGHDGAPAPPDRQPPRDPDARPPEEPRPPQEPRPPEEPRPPHEPRPQSLSVLDVVVVEQGVRGLKTPVPGPRFEVFRGKERVAWGQADERGRFRFRLPPATYTVKTTHPHFAEGTISVAVPPQGARREILLHRKAKFVPGKPTPPKPPEDARPVLELQIRVHDLRGHQEAAQGARVKILRDGNVVASGVADASGRYRVRLGRGTYRVECELLPRFGPTPLDVRLEPGRTVKREVVLKPVDIR